MRLAIVVAILRAKPFSWITKATRAVVTQDLQKLLGARLDLISPKDAFVFCFKKYLVGVTPKKGLPNFPVNGTKVEIKLAQEDAENLLSHVLVATAVISVAKVMERLIKDGAEVTLKAELTKQSVGLDVIENKEVQSVLLEEYAEEKI